MKFTELPLPGLYLVEPETIEDDRGFFARTYCRREFAARGLNPDLMQASISFNRRRGTLRGMHYQEKPNEEAKLVRVTQGAIYDVALDMRPESPAYLRWHAVELDQENHTALYIPEGVAHGFLTLQDSTEVLYQISAFYAPDAARGVRWDDPAFAISWPGVVEAISERDRSYPDFKP